MNPEFAVTPTDPDVARREGTGRLISTAAHRRGEVPEDGGSGQNALFLPPPRPAFPTQLGDGVLGIVTILELVLTPGK